MLECHMLLNKQILRLEAEPKSMCDKAIEKLEAIHFPVIKSVTLFSWYNPQKLKERDTILTIPLHILIDIKR